MPTNYMVFHGLINYCFKRVARELAERTFRMVLEENDVTREYYNADTGAGVGQKQFWGFSILGYVMPLELELGYDATRLGSPIQTGGYAARWRAVINRGGFEVNTIS